MTAVGYREKRKYLTRNHVKVIVKLWVSRKRKRGIPELWGFRDFAIVVIGCPSALRERALKRVDGKEKYQEIVKDLQNSSYFCKTFHSWERDAIENTNILIWKHTPKRNDFSEMTDESVSQGLNHTH